MNVQTIGEPTKGLDKSVFRRGALMHRFYSDEAIEAFCQANYLEAPKVRPNGEVTGYARHHDERITIGWSA